jgi:hypothetical protein
MGRLGGKIALPTATGQGIGTIPRCERLSENKGVCLRLFFFDEPGEIKQGADDMVRGLMRLDQG